MQHSCDLGRGFAIDPWIKALVVPAIFVGLDYRIASINVAATTMLQEENAPSLVGRSIRPLVKKDDAVGFFTDLLALQNDDGSLRDTSVNLVGSSTSGAFSVVPLRGSKHAMLGFLLQHIPDQNHDNDHRRKTWATTTEPSIADAGYTLEEQEWRWKMALDSASQGVWDYDFERDRHYVSKTWRDLRGLSAHDVIPSTTEEWLKTVHPSDVPDILEELDKLDSGQTNIINYKFRQRHAKGHWVWFYRSGRVVRWDAAGRPARFIGTDTDITEIKKVEMESQRLARRLDSAMQASGMGRWEFDVGAKYAFWDNRLLEISGIEDGINIRSANDWSDTIHPDDRSEIVALSEQCLAEERDINCEYRVLRPDGTIRFVRSRGIYAKDEDEGPRYYGVHIDITHDHERTRALEEARAQLEYESRHDALTSLANRRHLDECFSAIATKAEKSKNKVAVLHFDIDHFKQINDTLGHDAGDALLKHAAGVLKDNLPENVLVSRVGGDEFVALFSSAPHQQVLKTMAQQIIAELAKPFSYNSQLCNIGTSIGIALSKFGEPVDNNLFIHADLALYEAKKAGRGRVCFFDKAMKKEARRRKNSFDALLEGFDQGEITCHYQPQFDAQTLELTGVEALVRWESAKYGLIMPDEFLATAADMGLVAVFDELVLKQALEDLNVWEAAGYHVPRISVNVSSHRLNDPLLGQSLSKLKLPRGRLSFELLESAFLDSRNDVIDSNLALLDDLGIEIEIDDFGSGHASIVSLLQIKPKRLKIDRMLIGPVVESRRQRDLVSTIIGIGQMLDISVLAEGVETQEHVNVMKELGCCSLQGYGLARPMKSSNLQKLLYILSKNKGVLDLSSIIDDRAA